MNVVFDLGNVLLRWDPRFLFRKIFDDEARMEWFLAHVCNHDWNLEQDRGRSLAEGVALLKPRFPEYAGAIEAYHRRWSETLGGAIGGTVAILDDLHARGTALYALTNWNGDTFRLTRGRHAFLTKFRDIVVSGDEGLLKPDPAIYRLLLARNGLDASQSLFIDDSPANVKGAEAAGMKGYHFTTPEALRTHLQRTGLL